MDLLKKLWGNAKGLLGDFIAGFAAILLAEKMLGKEAAAPNIPGTNAGKAGHFAGKLLHAHIGGFTKNDEVLVNQAVVIAHIVLSTSRDIEDEKALERLELMEGVINGSFPEIADARNFRIILGHDSMVLPGWVQRITGLKSGNWEGALTLLVLARMNDDSENTKLKEHLKFIGAEDTLTEGLEGFGQTAKAIFEKLGGIKGLEELKKFDQSREPYAMNQEKRYLLRKINAKTKKKVPFFGRWIVWYAIIVFAIVVIVSNKGIGTFH